MNAAKSGDFASGDRFSLLAPINRCYTLPKKTGRGTCFDRCFESEDGVCWTPARRNASEMGAPSCLSPQPQPLQFSSRFLDPWEFTSRRAYF